MKKSLLVLPALMLLLAACTPVDPSSSVSSGTEDNSSESSTSEEIPVEGLIAKYDLNDVVRTAYVDGVNNKYTSGQFATFLKTKNTFATEVLTTSSGETNVYTAAQSVAATGPQFNGIKFGSSSVGGSVTLNFATGTNITKVIVGCAGWVSPNDNTVSIGGITQTPTQGGVSATVEAVEFEFAEALNTIVLSTNIRIIFNYIEIYNA